MSSAREEILARVRAAQGTGSAAPPRIRREYRRSGDHPHAQLVALFCERVADYRAEVEHVQIDAISDAIAAAASRHSAGRLAIPPELPHAWRPPSLELIPDDRLSPRELDRLDGVITGCTVAIAETGTIVLAAGPHEGRRALTLVPDLHICVVGADQVVATVPEAIAGLGSIVRETRSPLTLISGPSATSDIELQRVEGVHGPRRLAVLITQESA